MFRRYAGAGNLGLLMYRQIPTPTPKQPDVINFFIYIYNTIKKYKTMKILAMIPYAAILLANLLYLYIHGFNPTQKWYKVFFFNLCLMLLIGIFIIININIMLHRWLHDQRKVDQKGNPTKKQLIKKKIRSFLQYNTFLKNILLPGNQKILLKIYFGIAAWKWITSFIPGILMGLFMGMFFQYKDTIYAKFQNQIEGLAKMLWQVVKMVEENLPKHRKKFDEKGK